MRTIKFRAWDNERKIMTIVEEWDFDDGVSVRDPSTGKGWYLPLDKADIMQSTGLKDAKGKDCYEGDIVKTNGTYQQKNPKVVVWSKKVSGWNIHPMEGKTPVHGDRAPHLQIIGNIYESLELSTNQ